MHDTRLADCTHRFGPAHRAGQLPDQRLANGIDIVVRGHIAVLDHGHGGAANLGVGQNLAHRLGGRLHQRAVRRHADRQLDGAPRARRAALVQRPLHRRSVAGNNDLARGIIIGGDHDLIFGHFAADGGDHLVVQPEDGGHRTYALWNGRLHLATPLGHERDGGLEVERTGHDECRVFAQTVTGQSNRCRPAEILPDAPYRDRAGQHRRLGQFRSIEFFFGPFADQFPQVCTQDFAGLLKGLAHAFVLVGQPGQHADRL